ncbi:RND family transporter [Candidatus Margulisiibacteriota bacterium]
MPKQLIRTVRDTIIKRWSWFISKTYTWIVVICIVAAVLVMPSIRTIGFSFDWFDLFQKDYPMVTELKAIIDNFRSDSYILIVIEGEKNTITKFSDGLARELRNKPDLVAQVDNKLPLTFLRKYELLLFDYAVLVRIHKILKNPHLVSILRNINSDFEREYLTLSKRGIQRRHDELSVYLHGSYLTLLQMQKALGGNTRTKVNLQAVFDRIKKMNPLYSDPHYIGKNRRTLLMMVKPADRDSSKYGNKIIKLIKDYNKFYPDVSTKLTGTYILSKQEMDTVFSDVTRASIISIILVISIFTFSYRRRFASVVIFIVLSISIILTLFIASITVRSLNIITIIFGLIIVGLCIDLSIHLMTHFLEHIKRFRHLPKLLEDTFQKTGRATFISGLTTSAAFFSLLVTGFSGVQQFGFLVGSGIMISVIINLTFLPALLCLFTQKKWQTRLHLQAPTLQEIKKETKIQQLMGRLTRFIERYPYKIMLVVIILTIILGALNFRVQFEKSMIAIEPQDIESVKIIPLIAEQFGISPDTIFIMADSLRETRQLTNKIKSIEMVAVVDSITNYLDLFRQQQAKRALINKINSNLQRPTPEFSARHLTAPLNLRNELLRFEKNMISFVDKTKRYQLAALARDAERVAYTYIKKAREPRITYMLSRFNNPIEAVLSLPKIVSLQSQWKNLIIKEFRRLSSFDDRYITVRTLPKDIQQKYTCMIGNDRKYLITIIPKKSVVEGENQDLFFEKLKEISPKITGTFPLYHEALVLAARDKVRIFVLAFIVIIGLLSLNFMSFKRAFITLLPQVIGIIWLQGIMGLFGIKFNIINIMTIPLMLGISLSYGVHILEQYLVEGKGSITKVLKRTGKPLLISVFITIAVFATTLTAHHRGLFSFGLLLFIGVWTGFIAVVLITPALLKVFEKKGIRI